MDKTVAQLYRIATDTALKQVGETISSALSDMPPGAVIPTFFRADDIGVISKNFVNLLAIFEKHDMPLGLAVVPVWLTPSRWEAIRNYSDPCRHLWCWHQHGWKHTNHEAVGKKNEFGASRADHAIRSDLIRGKKRLETLLGADFLPCFTPPWNRCSGRTLDVLAQLAFHGISRSGGEQRDPSPLPDCFINVDLHTRKEPDPVASLKGLCSECGRAIKDRHLGIMIHHQRMNDAAFCFLDTLLGSLGQQSRLHLADMRDLSI